jgi:uncharacterized protein (TIGR00290 family)
MIPTVLMWSGGKDSALALDRVQRAGTHRVVALVTTINAQYRRVSMHGVREELLTQQADAIGLPLEKMYVGGQSSNEEYAAALGAILREHRARGVGAVIFGDIFLEDLRRWREALLSQWGLTGVFPLWKQDSRALYREFLARGFKALTCCVNDAWLDESHVGRSLDEEFPDSLPVGVDPCGENGEFHSFVHDGPVFGRPVPVRVGQKLYRPLQPDRPPCPLPAPAADAGIALPAMHGPTATKGFWFCDLLPDAQ